MKYRELLAELAKLSDEQLDCDITIAVTKHDLCFGECYPGEFHVLNDKHFWPLDDFHPVILVVE